MDNLIDITDLSVYFGRYQALRDVSFQVNKGDYINIVGPNGAGKSTLIKALLGLVPISTGNINAKTKQIGYLPQRAFTNDPIFPATVKEVVSTGLLANKRHPKRITSEDLNKINAILNTLQINDLKNRKIGSLSGGQQQRVFLARALISEPEVLVLDEPTSALDPDFRKEFYQLLDDLNQMQNVTILHITHDVSSVTSLDHKILYIDRGVQYFGRYENYVNASHKH